MEFIIEMTELVEKLSELNRKRKKVTQAEVVDTLEIMLLVTIFITCTYAVAPIL
jgi:hypothetical protein